MTPTKELAQRIETESLFVNDLLAQINQVIVGQERLVDRLLIALLADGHVLLEGVPGIAKTLAVNTLARALQLDFKRAWTLFKQKMTE